MKRLFNSPGREQAEQQALMNRLSARSERAIGPILVQTYRDAADMIEAMGTEAQQVAVANASKKLEKALGATIQVSARVFAKRLQGQIENLYPSKKKSCPIHSHFPDVFKAQNIQAEAEAQQRQALDNRLMFAPTFEGQLQAFAQLETAKRIVQINDTTKAQIRSMVMSGMEQGDTLTDIAKTIRTTSSAIGRHRAAVIARTEVHTASNAGMQTEAEGNEFEMRKSWSAVNDSRTRGKDSGDRFDHTRVDKSPIDMAASFDVSGEQLRYPGDPRGSAGNVINCRCSVLHYVV